MTWTIEEIEKGWLAGCRVAVSPEDLVSAFERCERVLGRDWIESQRAQRANELGNGPTLAVVRTGQQLVSLDGVANAVGLVEKLRRGDRSAASELHALHLLRFGPIVTAEIYPAACVGQSTRVPDIRAKSPDTWVYIEVTQPALSEAGRGAKSRLQAVTDLVDGIKQPFTLRNILTTRTR